MTSLFQVRCLYTGGQGMPGTNTFYGSEGDVAVADMRAELNDFYDVWCTDFMADDITLTIPSTGDIIDSTDGSLIGVWTDGTPIAVPGALTQARQPFTSQVLVQLKTDLVAGGRRLRGRVFLPGTCTVDNDDGVPTGDLLTAMRAAANTAFVSDFAVYSPTHHVWATVSSTDVWDQFAVLRSRRD